MTRSLTTYKETLQADGTVKMTVVGDMATDTGTDVNNDCKMWKYTLKDGLKYEDGGRSPRPTSPTALPVPSARTSPRARTTSSSGSPTSRLQQHLQGPLQRWR